MAEATVTLKLKPREFDCVRDALSAFKENAEDLINDPVVKEGDKDSAREDLWWSSTLLLKFTGGS